MTRSVPVLAAALAVVLVAGCTSKETDWSCPSGQERCDGQCVDPATYYVTAVDCGGCGISCGAGTCSGGACACGGATPTSCPASNPRCADLQTDRLNCGSCGVVCTKANAGCAGGSCACLAPFSDCGTSCANLQTDAQNCNQCGQVCPLTNDVCVNGGCACPAGLPDVCGSTCVNEQTDASNCGACGNVCPAGATCAAATCVCAAPLFLCGGGCVDRRTDAANCGSCGSRCAPGSPCCEGGCCAGGATCCANGACETQHSNGVGQSFFDCAPLGTYSEALALEAARAWRSSGTRVPGYGIACGTQQCVGWQTADACGTWCYGQDAWQGRVTVNTASTVCLCPADGSPRWN